jgi:hypothetical protein
MWSRYGGVEGARRLMRAPFGAVIAALAVLLLGVGSAAATHLFSNTAGHTTEEQLVADDNGTNNGYDTLATKTPGQSRIVRDGASESDTSFPNAQSGRDTRRQSLSYFAQLTDFQLADEESPGRVEFLDPGANAAWRPQEALGPFAVEYSLRQVNAFAGASPVQQGDGSRAAMDFALMTGDQADSAQRNETVWVRELLEGGTPLDFNSGVTDTEDPSAYNPTAHPSCAPYSLPPPPGGFENPPSEAPLYTGVQDYTDYDEGNVFLPQYYDPNDVRGTWATSGWPTYNGLLDRAQTLTLTPAGLSVPSYVTNGNHDPLVQGNEDPVAAFEAVATSCLKMLASTAAPANPGVPDPSVLLAPPAASTLVPPDPARRYVSKPQIKAIYGASNRDNDHGFDFVDPAQDTASNGTASYYAWDPPEAPGFRFINIDTVSEGGQTAEGVGCGSANGNIDDPQFQWLKGELDAATARDKLIVLFGHHPIRSLCTEIPDENAQPCTVQDNHGDTPEHDVNPGCDLDPRVSEPLHLGEPSQRPPGNTTQTLVELLGNYNHLIAYVPGHTHENKVLPCGLAAGCTGDDAWWEVNTSSVADWPQQSRLIEVMDNRDGTLSIFATIIDHASPATPPAPCATPGCASGFTAAEMASIARNFAYNDTQGGPPSGEGATKDKNVELLVPDPRLRGYARPQSATPSTVRLVPAFEPCIGGASTHAAPLAAPSCSPPQQTSDYLTVGTPDANGKPAVAAGRLGMTVVGESPINLGNGDQADVVLEASFTDVRNQGSLTDYTGELRFVPTLRITDRFNGPPGGPAQREPATTVEVPLPITVPCMATVDAAGATCNLTTGADAVAGGNLAREAQRAVWELGQIRVYDGGADGDADTTGDNTLFAVQGTFAP